MYIQRRSMKLNLCVVSLSVLLIFTLFYDTNALNQNNGRRRSSSSFPSSFFMTNQKHDRSKIKNNHHGLINEKQRRNNRFKKIRRRIRRRIRIKEEKNKVTDLLSDLRDMFNPEEVTEKVGVNNHGNSRKSSRSRNITVDDHDVNDDDCTSTSMLYLDKLRCGDINFGRNGTTSSSSINQCKTKNPTSINNRCQPKSDDRCNHIELELDSFDSIGKSFSLVTAGIVFIQSITSLLIHDDYALLDEIASKLLSDESAIAVKTIRSIIQNFPEHGVVDIFKEHPTKDVVMSILALSRLQSAVLGSSLEVSAASGNSFDWSLDLVNENEKGGKLGIGFFRKGLRRNSSTFNDSLGLEDGDILKRKINNGRNLVEEDDNTLNNVEYELLADLAHYAIFANAAYGWKMGLLGGKLHVGDLQTLLQRTGIEENNVIETNWKSQTHLPAYFIVQDVKRKKIVLCIRGTLSPKDILTDLCCTAEDFMSHEEETKSDALLDYSYNKSNDNIENSRDKFKSNSRARAHQGMVNSARGVAKATYDIIRSELDKNPDYKLVLVGHSLGGGVAAILGSFWKKTFPGLMVYAYGCPCVAPLNMYPTIDKSVISIVGEGDPFSCLSLGHLADASYALSKLCKDKELRDEILNITKELSVEEMNEDDVRWCRDTLESLSIQQHLSISNTEKFYPPGRVLHMKGNLFGSNVNEVTLTEVQADDLFRHLKLHPRMFDLSLHIPHRYEVLLARMWSKVNKTLCS